MRKLIFRLMAAIAAAAAPAAALAHAFLSQAVPAVDGVVASPPAEIRLTFSEGVEPRFSSIELTTSDGRKIDTAAAARLDPANNSILVLAVPALAPGRYRVRWYVVSVDTHSTQGDYGFEVRP